jgi:hypothetical protein
MGGGGRQEGEASMSDGSSWIAIFTNNRGGEVRFPLFENEQGKLFLKIDGKDLPYKIAMNDAEGREIVHFKTLRAPEETLKKEK